MTDLTQIPDADLIKMYEWGMTCSYGSDQEFLAKGTYFPPKDIIAEMERRTAPEVCTCEGGPQPWFVRFFHDWHCLLCRKTQPPQSLFSPEVLRD